MITSAAQGKEMEIGSVRMMAKFFIDDDNGFGVGLL